MSKNKLQMLKMDNARNLKKFVASILILLQIKYRMQIPILLPCNKVSLRSWWKVSLFKCQLFHFLDLKCSNISWKDLDLRIMSSLRFSAILIVTIWVLELTKSKVPRRINTILDMMMKEEIIMWYCRTILLTDSKF